MLADLLLQRDFLDLIVTERRQITSYELAIYRGVLTGSDRLSIYQRIANQHQQQGTRYSGPEKDSTLPFMLHDWSFQT